jgi:hypothetical protein
MADRAITVGHASRCDAMMLMATGRSALRDGAARGSSRMACIGWPAVFAVFAACIAAKSLFEIGVRRIAIVDIRSREAAHLGAAAGSTNRFFSRRCSISRLTRSQIVVGRRLGCTGRKGFGPFHILATGTFSSAGHDSAPSRANASIQMLTKPNHLEI